MSEVFTYETTPRAVNPLEARYPAQTDDEYWSKVPALFAEEFADKEKLKTFKSNWIVHRVPLYLTNTDSVTDGYIRDTVNLIFNVLPKERHEYLIDMFTEDKRGHTDDSYTRTTTSFAVEVDGIKYEARNVGLVRAMRLHNILSYEYRTGKKINDYDVIVEIGGGIGEFPKTVRDMGFKGDYHTIDFAPMCEINEYYNDYHEKNFYYTHVKDLPDLSGKKILFIGTWSFSEVPVAYREEIIAKLPPCDWLLAVQGNVMGVDNLNYFCHDFGPRMAGKKQIYHLQWHPYQGGNFYYFVS